MAKYMGENALTYFITLIKNALSGKVDTAAGKGLSANDYTSDEKTKLAGIAAGANNYTLPAATASELGGVKVGAGLAIAGGVLSATGGGTANAIAWGNVTGKPETYAPAVHTHAYAGSSGAGGAATTALACSGNAATATKATNDSAGQQINTTYIKALSVSGKVITYTKGNGATGTITTQDTNTTYGVATTSADGLMSATDKVKLDGLPAGVSSQMATNTATLSVAGWSNNAQTVSVSGVTGSNSVIVSPAIASKAVYGEAGVYCSAQASGTLTFSCADVPATALTVNILILI